MNRLTCFSPKPSMSSTATKNVSSCQRRPAQSRLGQRVNTESSGLTVGVSHTGQRSGGCGGGGRSSDSATCGAGDSTCGITSPARSTITSSPIRMSLRARSSSLCSVACLIVTPATRTGSSIAYGCRSPNLPGFQPMSFSVVTAVVGGNFHAIAHRGSRPTTPRRRCSANWLTLTTTPSISKSSEPRRRSHDWHSLHDLGVGVELLDVRVDGEAMGPQPFQRVPMCVERQPLGDADRVAPQRQRPLGGELGIQLADRARRGVARVHERREARLGSAFVERREIRQRHVDLAAHLQQRRRILHVQPQRDRADRAQVVRHVLADLAVAARGPALEHARRGTAARSPGRRSSARPRTRSRDPRSPRARGGCASAGSTPAAPRPSARWPATASARDG